MFDADLHGYDDEEEPDPNDPRTIEPAVSYYKKGDDFASALEQAKGDVPKALESWADRLAKDAVDLRKLAAAIREKAPDATGDGMTHGAFIYVDREIGAELKAREDLKDAIVVWQTDSSNG
jgi:hypothetical protein